MCYNWQQKDWPEFKYDLSGFEAQLFQIVEVLRRMLEAGPKGFQGGMNAKKYSSITKVSKATSTRDLQKLVELEAFIVIGAGRSTRYEIKDI